MPASTGCSTSILDFYEHWVRRALARPGLTVLALSGLFLVSLAIYPLLGLAFFPKTDAGQFTINLKVPTGTRIEVTDQYVAKVEDLIRHNVDPRISSGSSPILAWCLTSPRSIPPTPGPTPRPFKSPCRTITPAQQFRVHGPGADGDEPASIPIFAHSFPAVRWSTRF